MSAPLIGRIEPTEPEPTEREIVQQLGRAIARLKSFHRAPAPPQQWEREELARLERFLARANRAVGLLLVLLSFSFCSMAHADARTISRFTDIEHRTSFKTAALWHGAFVGLDGTATELSIYTLRDRHGNPWLRERNPITDSMPGRAGRVGMFVVQAGAYSLIDTKLQKRHKRLVWLFRGATALAHSWGAFTNVRGSIVAHRMQREGKLAMAGRQQYLHPPGWRPAGAHVVEAGR